jgi:hypothetical protein
MGAHTYVPELGRFLQIDPVKNGSANQYDYSNQDPLDQVDLEGCAAAMRTPTCSKFKIRCKPGGGWRVECAEQQRQRQVQCAVKCDTVCNGETVWRRTARGRGRNKEECIKDVKKNYDGFHVDDQR